MDVLARIRKPKKAATPSGDDAQREDAPRKGGRKPAGKRKVSVSTIVVSIILVIGLGIMAYPSISDWWNSYHQSRAIQSYVQTVAETDPKVIKKMLDDANAYNKRLLKNDNRYNMTDEQRTEYNSLLNLDGTGMMGYVNIPSIGVNLPVYHGVDETHLQVAVGHIEGSSLPVGGKGTHTVVSAHRGLPSAKLFSELDRLTEGDIFTFTVLDQTITYEVDQIRIVEPSNLTDLALEQDKDYATLVTCTPYGVNTHRMLVRGHRIKNLEERSQIPAGAVQIPSYIAVLAVAIPLLFVYLLGALIFYRHRHPELDKQKALDVVREHAMKAEVSDDDDGGKHNESASKKE